MDFQLLLIYSRVNCCTARGLAVGVGAEPRRPSGRPAGHIMQRQSWLLHLPGAGFKMHACTCRGCSALSQKEERKVGFHCPPCSSVRSPGILVEVDPSVGSRKNVRSALVAGSYQGLEPGASHMRMGHFPLTCSTWTALPFWFGGILWRGKRALWPKATMWQCCRQPPGPRKVSGGASTDTHAWLCPATEITEKAWPSAAVCFDWHFVVQGARCRALPSCLVPVHSVAPLALSVTWVSNHCASGTAQLSLLFSPTSMAPVRLCRRICISFSRLCKLVRTLAMFWQARVGNVPTHLTEQLISAFLVQLERLRVWSS